MSPEHNIGFILHLLLYLPKIHLILHLIKLSRGRSDYEKTDQEIEDLVDRLKYGDAKILLLVIQNLDTATATDLVKEIHSNFISSLLRPGPNEQNSIFRCDSISTVNPEMSL